MKRKLIRVILLCTLFIVMLYIPAGASGVSEFTWSPKRLKDVGGECTLEFTINNTNALTIDRYQVYAWDVIVANRDCDILSGESQAVAPTIDIKPTDLDVWIPIKIKAVYSDGTKVVIKDTAVLVESIPDVIYSTNTSVEPQSDVYHIGERVVIKDNFFNRGTDTAENVVVQYYKKSNGTILYDDAKTELGTIHPDESKDYDYYYMFVPDDVGEIEIASIVRYSINGVEYEEFCVAHFFQVDEEMVTPAPTPTASPEVTPSPTPVPTNAPSASYIVEVTADSTSVNAGDDVLFSIVVTNTGAVDITNIDVYDNDVLIATFDSLVKGDAARYLYTVNIDKTTAFNFSAKTSAEGKRLNVFADIVTVNVGDNKKGTDGSKKDNDFTFSNPLVAGGIGVGSLLFIVVVALTIVLLRQKKDKDKEE